MDAANGNGDETLFSQGGVEGSPTRNETDTVDGDDDLQDAAEIRNSEVTSERAQKQVLVCISSMFVRLRSVLSVSLAKSTEVLYYSQVLKCRRAVI